MVFGAKVFDFCRFFPNKFLTGEVVQTLVAPAAFGFTAIFPREKSVGKTFFAQLKETFAEISVKPRAGQTWRGFRGFRLPYSNEFKQKSNIAPFFPLMNLLVTTHAQALEIAIVISAAIGKRLQMMHQRCHRCSPLSKTHFAKRMRCDVSVTDFLPRTSISLMLIVPTRKMLVVPLHHLSVFLAISRLAVGQIGATAITTGAFWFLWHSLTSFWA